MATPVSMGNNLSTDQFAGVDSNSYRCLPVSNKHGALLPEPDVNTPGTVHATSTLHSLRIATQTHAHRYDEHTDTLHKTKVDTWRIYANNGGGGLDEVSPAQAKTMLKNAKG